jgi:hypothetical protein
MGLLLSFQNVWRFAALAHPVDKNHLLHLPGLTTSRKPAWKPYGLEAKPEAINPL